MKKIKKKARISTVCSADEFNTKRTPVLMAAITRSEGKTALCGAGCQRESTTTTYRKAMALRRSNLLPLPHFVTAQTAPRAETVSRLIKGRVPTLPRTPLDIPNYL
jgi:hypothetical protein